MATSDPRSSENTVGAGGAGTADAGVVPAADTPTVEPIATATAGNGSNDAEPIKRCAMDNGGCDTSPIAICTDHTAAARGCECPKGYSGDGVGADGCQNVAGCVQDNGGCGSATYFTCTDNVDAAPTCNDIDERAKDNGGCSTSPRATCLNNSGAGPSCTCPSGYSGIGLGSAGCTSNFTYDETTVKEPSSGLTWQRGLPAAYAECAGRYSLDSGNAGDACSWEEARSYCTRLTLAGSGWRLPDKDELLSIVDMSRRDPSIQTTTFPDTPAQWFWSSSAYVGASGSASGVNFYDGSSAKGDLGNTCRVRCVR